MKLQYLSHSAFKITAKNGKRILIDPFIEGNPTAPVKADELDAEFIITTHGHPDHIGDTESIAKRCNSKIIAVFELANWFAEKGLDAHTMHIGGGNTFDFGKIKFTIAHHGSSTPDGKYAGEPAGVLLFIDGKTIYHTGDTGLFLDMKLIGEMNDIDYMLVPIGDNFTMDVRDGIKAVELTKPKVAIPMHYNTFPIIEADPNEFKIGVEKLGIGVKVLEFGEEIEL